MTADVMVVIERQFDYPRPLVFRAWTAPEELARWRGSPGWHVEPDTVTAVELDVVTVFGDAPETATAGAE